MSSIITILVFHLTIVWTIKTDIYCDYRKPEFYLSQGDFCKRCDRCPPGFGMEELKDRKVEFDPVHGALECRRCAACSPGCFSKTRSFKECRLCRNCTSEGRVELRKCTQTSNAKCGNILQDLSHQIRLTDYSDSETVHVHLRNEKTDEGDDSVYVLAVIPALLVITMITTVGLFCLHRKRLGKKKHVIEQNINHSKGQIERVNIEQYPMLVPNDISVVCDLEDDCVAVSSVLESWKKEHDYNEPLRDEHVLYLSKLIATDNTFHKIGIKLGIPENEIAIIKTNHSGDVFNQAYYTLDKWRKLKGESAFVLVILNELHELERNDIVEKFCSVHR